jgi:hypothetical protein
MTEGGPRIGKCIYCGSPKYWDEPEHHPLGDEHVIPKKLGGTITVLEAACQCCEKKINQLAENITINKSLNLLRHHLGLPSGNRLETVQLKIEPPLLAPYTVELPISEVPPKLLMPVYTAPGALTGSTPVDSKMVPPEVRPIRVDKLKMDRLIARFRGRKVTFPEVKFDFMAFGLMLAKIGHAFTVHELKSPDAFRPFLTDHIRGKLTGTPLSHYIGSANMNCDVLDAHGNSLLVKVKDGQLHRLTLMQGFGSYQVYVQLFGAFEMPPYIVVTGTTD